MKTNSEHQLQNGDMVEALGPLPFPRHVGIYAAGHGIVHNSKAGSVQLTDLASFSGGAPIRAIWRVSGTWLDQQAAVDRAMSLVGRRYDLLHFNCEHVAYYALTGKPRSPQLGFALAVLALIGILLFVTE